MKSITFQISDKHYDFLERLAKSENRKFTDFIILIFMEGLDYFWNDSYVMIKKKKDEFTKQEIKQKQINKQIKKQNPNVHAYDELRKLGYKTIANTFDARLINIIHKKLSKQLIK